MKLLRREAAYPVCTVERVQCDAVAGVMHLHSVTVELDLEEPAFALGETVAEGRIAGWDERVRAWN